MTKTCEALSEVSTTTEMLYCVKHERMVEVEDGGHQFVNGGWDFGEVEVCTFPLGYAFCAPPDDDGDWAAQDVSEEERALAELDEQGMWLGGGE
jgi:hypothetical protein